MVENGIVECYGGLALGESNNFGSTCVLVCDEGWRAEGVARIDCNSMGKWSTSLDGCIRKQNKSANQGVNFNFR